MTKVTKLVLPVAGRGKRLLPLTLDTPKNLIPINGRPLLEYVLEEAVKSNIKEVVLVVNPDSLKDFKRYLLKNAERFCPLKFHIRVQETPGGNGHAIVKAGDLIKNEPFAVRFCDDIVLSEKPILASLIEIFKYYKHPVLLLERVPKKLVSRFGVVGARNIKRSSTLKQKGRIFQITKIVEKPKPELAPSNLTIVGGYVLTPAILRNLKSVADTLPVIADDALPIAVALQIELLLGGKILGWEFSGRRLDCGTIEKLKKTEEFLRRAT